MSCDEARERIELLPLEALEPDQLAALEAHLLRCGECRAASEALLAAYGAFAAQVAEDAGEAPAGARERVLAAASAGERGEWDVLDQQKKPVVAEASPVDPARVEAVGQKIALSCSYCHAHAGREEVVFCASCLAPHHAECFSAHGRCSLPGCQETETVRPGRTEAPAAPRRARGKLLLLVCAAAVPAAAAALAWSQWSLRARTDALRARAYERELVERERELAEERARAAVERESRARLEAEREQQQVRADAQATVDLTLNDTPLEEAALSLGAQAQVNVIVDPQVRERVSVTLRQVTWREALEVLARLARCEVEDRGGGVFVLTQPPLVTISHTDANVRTVLQLLAAYSGRNVVIGPEVQGQVTPDLKEVRWDAALLAVAHAAGTRAWLVGEELIYVGATPPQGATPLQVASARAPAALAAGPTVDLELSGATVVEACAAIARAAQRPVEVQELARDDPRRVTLRLRATAWQTALHLVAERTDCQVTLEGAGAVVRPVVRLARLRTHQARLGELLPFLSGFELRGLNVVVGADAAGRTVSLDLSGARPGEALEGALAAAGCELVEEGRVRRVRVREGSQDPPAGRPAGRGHLELTALAQVAGRAQALLSGRVYREGERLLDFDEEPLGVVSAVGSERVQVTLEDGRVLTLDLDQRHIVPIPPPVAPAAAASRPSLGIAVEDLELGGGVRVMEVMPGGWAAAAGVRPGDVLISLDVRYADGRTVANLILNMQHLARALEAAEPGAPVELHVLREGKTLTLKGALPR